MSKDLHFTVLLDIYGSILTSRQREMMEYYYNDDLSLGEISEMSCITRQGVLSCIQKSEKHLQELEESLHLGEKLKTVYQKIEVLDKLLNVANIKDEILLTNIKNTIAEIKDCF